MAHVRILSAPHQQGSSTRGNFLLQSSTLLYNLCMIQNQGDLDAALLRMKAEGTDLWAIEVKRTAGGVPDVKDTLSAFANMPDGGTIIFGLDEARGFAPSLGVPAADIRKKVASWARNGIYPPVDVRLHDLEVSGSPVVIANVAPLASGLKPARVGPHGPAYSRFDEGDYPLSEAEVQQILARRERPREDIKPVLGTSIDDLDAELLHEFLQRVRKSSIRLDSLDDTAVLRARRVIADDGQSLTKAGIYALGFYPQTHFPQLRITAIRQSADPGVRNADRREFDGPIPALLSDAVEWVMRNVRQAVRERADGHLRNESELPALAVRELIANALVHRDLTDHASSRSVVLHLDHTRLRIQSPGGLWGIALRELGTPGGKSAVNEHLYDICQLLATRDGNRVIEGEGGGIAAARHTLSEAGLKPPVLHAAEVRFVAEIPRESLLDSDDLAWLRDVAAHEYLTPVQSALAAAMRHGRVWTNQAVREEFGIDAASARKDLQRLVQANIAITDGERGSTKYYLNSHDQVGTSSGRIPTIFDAIADMEDPRRGSDTSRTASLPQGERNRQAIMNALSTAPRTARDLSNLLDLTPRQVSYALRLLIDRGIVHMNGAQGSRGATYQLQDRP